jgi:hypothetical protein
MSLTQHPVDAYIEQLPAPQRRMVERLHQLMLVHPGVSTRLRFGIPFYDIPFQKKARWFAYVNPLKSGRVECCFLKGRRIVEEGDPSGLLEHRDRKMVAGILLQDMADLTRKEEALLEVVDRAMTLEAL